MSATASRARSRSRASSPNRSSTVRTSTREQPSTGSVRIPAGSEARCRSMVVLAAEPAREGLFDYDVRSVPGGFLVQDWDRAGFDRASTKTVTRRPPTEAEWEQLGLAWTAVKHVKSNAIVLFKDGAAVGVGAGQMSRVEAVHLAVQRAGDRSRGSVLASDAFFPFPDGLELGIEAGITAAIQPGVSVKDTEVVAAADAAGIAMVVTGGRQFKH